MSSWLAGKGHLVTVISEIGGPMQHTLGRFANVVISQTSYGKLCGSDVSFARAFLKRFVGKAPIDVFYSVSDDSLWVASGLLNAQGTPARCLAAVYGPSDFGIGEFFSWLPGASQLTYPESFLFAKVLHPSSRVFMNSAMQRQQEIKNRCELEGRIWPLPVDDERFTRTIRQPETGLIVSVGRLAQMKEYNLWMIDIVKELLDAGVAVRWEVFGEGPYKETMAQRIKDRGLQAHISLRGEISYDRLPEAFERAWVFVGMGTALIEAGMAGVPAISATVYDESGYSHGFLHELPEYSCGEPLNQPVRRVRDMLQNVASMNEQEYSLLAAAGRQHAKQFALETLMSLYLDLIETAPLVVRIWRPNWCYACASKYRAARDLWKSIRR